MNERTAALIVAAGASTRFGGPLPKVFAPLAGAPLVVWSLRAYARHPEVECLCLVVASQYLDQARALCEREVDCACVVAAGGPQRRQSVRNGLLALEAFAPDLVAIHDGARPLVTEAIITDSLRRGRECGAALAAVPASDTVKQVELDARVCARFIGTPG